MDTIACRHFFAALKKRNPHPQTELHYGNHYQLLVAVVLSAQATDVGVNRATEKLFARVKSAADMLALGEKKLLSHIRTIGLYRAKGKNVMALSAILQQQHGGKVPNDREALEQLPGVGRKTANVVLNTAFGQPTIAVDTHIFRVSNRTGLAKGKDVRAVEESLLQFVPKTFRLNAHHWLILHGRYICKARQPLCGQCPVIAYCDYAKENKISSTEKLPLTPKPFISKSKKVRKKSRVKK